ncbi:histidine triad nucleotide-binding protein [bacterium]|nr:histidine triad nucleotide-binding protein [bacterium]
MPYDDNGIFAKIIRKEIPAKIVHETDTVLAFEDINAKAPIHILIVPKVPVESVNDLQDDHAQIMGEVLLAARDIAKQLNIDEKGYRLVINTNSDAGQEIFHLHVHLLAGRKMTWPPG